MTFEVFFFQKNNIIFATVEKHLNGSNNPRRMEKTKHALQTTKFKILA